MGDNCVQSWTFNRPFHRCSTGDWRIKSFIARIAYTTIKSAPDTRTSSLGHDLLLPVKSKLLRSIYVTVENDETFQRCLSDDHKCMRCAPLGDQNYIQAK